MIQIRNRTIKLNGDPRLVLCGEIHYFRVERPQWEARLDAAAAVGFNAIASYIPWLVHELPDGSFDFTGRAHDTNDLGAFIDLTAARGMKFIARPGPFVMAEIKNEGIPYRLREIPEIMPRSWDDAPPPVPTLDLGHPVFLAEARKWYQAVGEVLAPRMDPAGGPIILVQLDNEIGMLDWVSNAPCLSDHLIAEFAGWLTARHGRRFAELYPESVTDPLEQGLAIRSPGLTYSTQLRIDLGRFMRGRFSSYVDALAEMARESGFGNVPFAINIHGTSAGFAHTFPIGISQLWLTYAHKPGFISGSDIYLGQPNLRNFAELHMINAMMESLHDADQPVTSLEFEAGTGDYASALEFLQDPSTVDLKTRLCVAQNHKLLNYYLLAGGRNRLLDTAREDGESRIATTGERHGFAAPLDPEGQESLAWGPTVAAVRAMRANEGWLAGAVEERDNIALGWCPDYYLTEYRYPGASGTRDPELIGDLEGNRSGGPRHALPRMLLYSGYRYGAVNLQEPGWSRRANRPAVVAFAAAGQLDPAWQAELLEYVRSGGGLFLYGNIPTQDMVGMPCPILADAMGISSRTVIFDSPGVYLSARPEGWAAPGPDYPKRADVRCGFAHTWDAGPNEVLARLLHTGEAIAFDARVGSGRIITLTADYPTDLEFAAEAFARLGARRGLEHDSHLPSLVLTSTFDGTNRLLHIMNIAGYSDATAVRLGGEALFGGQLLEIAPYSAMALPIGAELPLGRARVPVAWSTAELAGNVALDDGRGAAVTWRLTQSVDRIMFARHVLIDAGGRPEVVITHQPAGTLVTVTRTTVEGSFVARDLAARVRAGLDELTLVIRPA
ncbi:MAG: beta-galactosidase [Candidatus Nanopelagicales bacterium]